jgi:hypothetical protein
MQSISGVDASCWTSVLQRSMNDQSRKSSGSSTFGAGPVHEVQEHLVVHPRGDRPTPQARGRAAVGVDRRSAANGVTDPAPGRLRGRRRPGQPSGVADGRGASPSDLWRPSVQRRGPAGEVIPATRQECAGWVLAGNPRWPVPGCGGRVLRATRIAEDRLRHGSRRKTAPSVPTTSVVPLIRCADLRSTQVIGGALCPRRAKCALTAATAGSD